ncbi:hypothetical protein F5Y18DRAFT_434697 [Xylariaceae sp. FL1019]|nr:hypothetical protein F5Y18DRAFT_434697 [Xylariaceae sp. FL1019]
MDQIYSQAYITLIAAAGDDSSYGLPGTQRRKRRQQGLCTIGEVRIIQIFPHASAELSTSKWAERGWTYQEGYLSPRRLIFTDDQVSYLCNAMHYTETVKKAQELSENESFTDRCAFLDIVRSSSSNTTPNEQWNQLKSQLLNYTKRKLTREYDSLNAALGMFNTLESSRIQHLYGIPLRRRGSIHELSIAWYHDNTGTRRQLFPSWSWSGWEGGIYMNEDDVRIPGSCKIDLVDSDDNTVTLTSLTDKTLRGGKSSSPNVPKTLSITGLTLQVTFKEEGWADLSEDRSYRKGLHVVLPVCERVMALAYAYMDEIISPDEEILGLLLGPKDTERHWKQRRSLLLLKHIEGQIYQRVGLARISFNPHSIRGKVGGREPQIVYVDEKGKPLDQVAWSDNPPLWLGDCVSQTIKIV